MKTEFDTRTAQSEVIPEDVEADADNTEPERDRFSDPKDRKCLMCGKTFPSGWVGERICRKCKSSAAWRTG